MRVSNCGLDIKDNNPLNVVMELLFWTVVKGKAYFNWQKEWQEYAKSLANKLSAIIKHDKTICKKTSIKRAAKNCWVYRLNICQLLERKNIGEQGITFR